MTGELLSKIHFTMPEDQPPEPEVDPTVGQRGRAYPIRILHLVNDITVIGMVIHVTHDTLYILRPHYIDVDYDEDRKNLSSYTLIPYLDQLVHYDANSMSTTPFLTYGIASMSIPAQHLLNTYMTVTRFKEHLASAPEGELYTREYPDGRILH